MDCEPERLPPCRVLPEQPQRSAPVEQGIAGQRSRDTASAWLRYITAIAVGAVAHREERPASIFVGSANRGRGDLDLHPALVLEIVGGEDDGGLADGELGH